MKHLIVYAHSHQDSLNRSILNTTVSALQSKGNEVIVRDPLSDVRFRGRF